MSKAALMIGLLLALSAPLFAQGPFADVPTDHWAYEAINQLQQDGILIGYPDGTFGGKRAMTRFEFAVAIARMIPIIQRPGGPAGVSREEFDALQKRVSDLEKRPPGVGVVDTSQFATKQDVENLRKLVDEFRDELAALGVDVDALKRDVAALNDRVTALENEMRRVKWNGDFDTAGTAGDLRDPGVGGVAFDRDDRAIAADNLDENISALHNFDLKVRGALTDTAAANAMIVFGNYLNWVGTVDDYSVFTRPDSKFNGLSEAEFFPYYLNVDWALGNGRLTLGRIPMQWTPYTLRMIDVDSYINIPYTDIGDYPVDGARLIYNFGSLKLDAFASKNNENTRLLNGLTGQPTSGLYNDVLVTLFPGVQTGGPLNVLGGHAAGGLASIDQSAGVRLQFGSAARYLVSGSWMQAAGTDVLGLPAVAHDSVDVIGADLNLNISRFLVGGQWATTDTKGIGAAPDIDDESDAIEAKVGFNVGSFGIDAGWKRVERNFSAPGFWDKLGRWTNPANVEGPFVGLTFGLTSNLSIIADASFYEGSDDIGLFPVGDARNVMNDTADEVLHVEAGLKWGLSSANTVTLGVEWVQWDPSGSTDTTDEVYYNIGWGYQINPSAGFKLMYQIADYNAGVGDTPYGPIDYRGNSAIAQFGVKF